MQKFGAARVAQMVPFMKSVFESVGVMGYSLEGNVSSTLDSHRLLEHALAQPDGVCLLYTSPSPRDQRGSRMPSSA